MASDEAGRGYRGAAMRGRASPLADAAAGGTAQGLDSTVADIANVSGDRSGGMLIAGLFLREFVPDGVRLGAPGHRRPGLQRDGAYGYTPKGGTGAAVRALVAIAAETAARRAYQAARTAASDMMKTG